MTPVQAIQWQSKDNIVHGSAISLGHRTEQGRRGGGLKRNISIHRWVPLTPLLKHKTRKQCKLSNKYDLLLLLQIGATANWLGLFRESNCSNESNYAVISFFWLHFWHQICGFFWHQLHIIFPHQLSSSLMPTECLTTHFHFNANYSELSDCMGSRAQSHKMHPTSQTTSHRVSGNPPLQIRGFPWNSSGLKVHYNYPQNMGKHLNIYLYFRKCAAQEQPNRKDAWGRGSGEGRNDSEVLCPLWCPTFPTHQCVHQPISSANPVQWCLWRSYHTNTIWLNHWSLLAH